jgi:hypothetical protein
MGELIDLDAYRRRKQHGLPRLASSRDRDEPRPSDNHRLGLPKPPDRPEDPDAPEPA